MHLPGAILGVLKVYADVNCVANIIWTIFSDCKSGLSRKALQSRKTNQILSSISSTEPETTLMDMTSVTLPFYTKWTQWLERQYRHVLLMV